MWEGWQDDVGDGGDVGDKDDVGDEGDGGNRDKGWGEARLTGLMKVTVMTEWIPGGRGRRKVTNARQTKGRTKMEI